jgi:hypothetical protein
VARSLLSEGKPLEDAVLGADGLGEEAVLRFLAESFELEFIEADRLEKSPPSKEFLSLFPARLLLRHRILPIEERDGVTIVATSRITETAGLGRASPCVRPRHRSPRSRPLRKSIAR